MSLTEEQKEEVRHLCKVLGISKLEAIARVVSPAEPTNEPNPSSDDDDDLYTVDPEEFM